MEDWLDDILEHFPGAPVTTTMLETIVSSAKSNHPKRLVLVLNDFSDEQLIKYILNSKFDDFDGQSITPLTMGSMSGNITFVKTLLSHYNIDLEVECNVIYDGLVVYGATALWVAAGMGHMQIVKMLVARGANVNHNTKAQSSPLRAACYEGCLEIVRYLIEHGADVNLANTYNNTCIMIAAYKGNYDVVETLLHNGADPNVQALCGATALHYAAECGHLSVCRLLLKNGAVLLPNEYGLTPVLQAADRTHADVVQLFCESIGLMHKEEIINAYELLGASYANDKDKYDVSRAYEYLMRAMEMRFENPAEIVRKRVMAPVREYDNWFETENIPELRAIRLNHHSIHMEGLTVRERILGKQYPDLAQQIIYRGAVMADLGLYKNCQALWNYAIDLRMINNISVERDLVRFAQLFSQILRHENMTSIDLATVLSVLVKCQQEIENNKYKIKNPGPKDVPNFLADQNQQNILTALYLVNIITRLPDIDPKSEQDRLLINELYDVLRKFIRCDTRLATGQTLLHLAVNGVTPVDDFQFCKFPCARTSLLLIHVGASVTTVDYDLNTPLHTLVSARPDGITLIMQHFEEIIEQLVRAGAHMDAVNAQGLTPLEACHFTALRNRILAHQNNSTSLKCIAARCIALNKIKYQGLIPKSLEPFIQMHSAEKFDGA